jgi:hypothetical protein
LGVGVIPRPTRATYELDKFLHPWVAGWDQGSGWGGFKRELNMSSSTAHIHFHTEFIHKKIKIGYFLCLKNEKDETYFHTEFHQEQQIFKD